MVVSGTNSCHPGIINQEGDRLMKKILIVVITTLGLVMGMGSTLGTAEAAKKPSKFKVIAEVSSHTIISGQIVFVTGTTKPLSIGRKVILQQRYKKDEGQVEEGRCREGPGRRHVQAGRQTRRRHATVGTGWSSPPATGTAGVSPRR